MAKYNKAFDGNTVVVVNDNVDRALSKFKKKVLASGLIRELRERAEYTKPTSRRKQLKNAAKRRWAKKLASEQLPKKLY
jgi:ribosomal protein S21